MDYEDFRTVNESNPYLDCLNETLEAYQDKLYELQENGGLLEMDIVHNQITLLKQLITEFEEINNELKGD